MAAQGGTVVTAFCADDKTQLWKADSGGEIVNDNGLCMTPAGLNGGKTMLVQTCEQNTFQQWSFHDGRMWSGMLCLTVRGPYDTPGATIQTWDTAQVPEPADEMYWKLSA